MAPIIAIIGQIPPTSPGASHLRIGMVMIPNEVLLLKLKEKGLDVKSDAGVGVLMIHLL